MLKSQRKPPKKYQCDFSDLINFHEDKEEDGGNQANQANKENKEHDIMD